jgi:hypothetical protein
MMPDKAKYKCKAQSQIPSEKPEFECYWPECRCDPYANKVMDKMRQPDQESMDIIRRAAAHLKKDMEHIEANGCMTDSPKARAIIKGNSKQWRIPIKESIKYIERQLEAELLKLEEG